MKPVLGHLGCLNLSSTRIRKSFRIELLWLRIISYIVLNTVMPSYMQLIAKISHCFINIQQLIHCSASYPTASLRKILWMRPDLLQFLPMPLYVRIVREYNNKSQYLLNSEGNAVTGRKAHTNCFKNDLEQN